jgi:signal peptidase I
VARLTSSTSSSGEDEAADSRSRRRAEVPLRRGRRRRSSFLRELPILLVSALVLTLIIQGFVARVYVIPSESMENTLHGCTGCVNDRVLVDKVVYGLLRPEPGDVVVFHGPDTWKENDFETPKSDNLLVRWMQDLGASVGLTADDRTFVKRVIAVGGQTVQCCDAQNRVLVDGKPLNEPYVYWLPGTGPADQKRFPPVTVPDNDLFLMGDNRNNSDDSRYQGGGGLAGMVPVRNLIGKARLIVLPTDRWSGVSDFNPQTLADGSH